MGLWRDALEEIESGRALCSGFTAGRESSASPSLYERVENRRGEGGAK